MGRQLTLTDTLLEALPEAPVRRPGSWEVGRLVLAPECRTDPELLRRCLWLSLDYLCAHAHAPHLYASCSHVLGRLYRRFGFNAFATDVPLAGTDKRYTLIYGHAPRVLQALDPNRAEAARQ